MEGKTAGAPAQAVAVGDAPAAPKSPEVGRVARRARPDAASLINTCCKRAPPYPKGGA